MCPGINSFTFWCGSTDPAAEARTHRKKRDVCAPPEAGFGCASAPNSWERSRNVSWNQSFHEVRAYRGIPCVGEYLYGAPVLVPAARRWVGPELRRCG